MRWNYVPSPHSIYQDVAKLAPGHRLSVRSGAEPCIVRWWDVRAVTRAAAAARPELSDDEAVDLLEKRLGEAVRCRMISDVPLGAFLSGGIDSSAVAALMQANSSRPVRTFTIGFDEQGYNEAQFAREVSSHLGTDHTELIVRPQDALDAIPKLPEIYDEPFADSSQIPTFLVSQMTRRDVTVALSGDGGDELFAGYTRYDWADMVWRRFGGMALPLRQGLASLIRTVPSPIWRLANAMLAPPHRQDLVRERAFKLAAFISERNADAVYRLQHSHWQQPDRAVPGGFEPRGITWDEGLAGEFPDFVERMQIMDTLSYLPDDILTKVDRASMAVSLETRVPLLDHRVVELAWTLGPRHKRRRGQNKWILRQLLRRHLPAGFFDRPKKGFSVPIAAWLRGALRDWAEDLLSLRNLQDGEILNGPLVRQTWEAFLRGEEPAQEAIWGVLMFCAWRGRQGLLS
jgi:asparagine synthase (glutamine-hydrolysing)